MCLFFFEFVFLYDLIWYFSEVYAGVLWALQWCHEVKFGYVDFHEPGSLCRDDAVEEDVCEDHICRGCGCFTWVVYFVSAYGESCSVLLYIFGSYTAYELSVS